MKRFLIVFVAVMMLAVVVSCGNNSDSAGSDTVEVTPSETIDVTGTTQDEKTVADVTADNETEVPSSDTVIEDVETDNKSEGEIVTESSTEANSTEFVEPAETEKVPETCASEQSSEEPSSVSSPQGTTESTTSGGIELPIIEI